MSNATRAWLLKKEQDEPAMGFRKNASCSARILVAVKSSAGEPMFKLLFSKLAQKGDRVCFLHVAAGTQGSIDLEDMICSYVLQFSEKIPKVIISTLVVQSESVGDAIVEEARRMKATVVLLGSSQFLSMSMNEIGKFCVRNLRCYCSVVIARGDRIAHIKSGSAKCNQHMLKELLQRVEVAEERTEAVDSFTETESTSSSSSSGNSLTSSGSTCESSCSPNSVLGDLHRNYYCKQSIKFTYEELVVATQCFAGENLVGSGGCSRVYKGMLQDGFAVAVKKLLENTSGHREFAREISVVSLIRHPNVLPLVGLCNEGQHKLLVYELMLNGSLQQFLHGGSSTKSFSWKVRQKIALGAAKGLEHLHQLHPHHVIHHDVKSSNILLAKDFEARISDFGLARWSNELANSSCNDLVGTFGYMAPEYLMGGVASEKADVYSFGVVLLEILTGRSPIDSTLSMKKPSIIHWARCLERQGATHEMVDPRLHDIDPYELKRMMHAAFLCIRTVPEERPDMKRVVKILDPDVFCTEPLLSRPTD